MIAQNLHESNTAERKVSILSAPRQQDILLISVGKLPRTRRIDLQIGYLVSSKIQVKQVQSKYPFKYKYKISNVGHPSGIPVVCSSQKG